MSAVQTDSQLSAQAVIIKNETAPLANTATRVGTILDDLAANKINIDKISTSIATDTGSTTKLPTVAAVEAALTASTSVLTAKVTLSSAEILALFTTPKQLIAAPGAGKIIVPLAVSYRLNFNSIAYTTNLNLRLRMNGTLTQNSGILGLGATSYSLQPLAGGAYSADITNTALTIDVATGNPAAGNSTMDVYVTYTIVTL